MARLPWLWNSVLVVTFALVAFALAVTTLILLTRLVLAHQRRRHVRPGWEVLESSGNGQMPQDRVPWQRQWDTER